MKTFLNSVKRVFEKKYYIICILSVLAFALYTAYYVILHSDDFTYKQVAICNFSQILSFIKWHLMHYNGRTLVHILIIAFLKYDIGFYIWKILCPVVIVLAIIFISKLVSRNSEEFGAICVLASLLFLSTGQIMFCTSIFWLSGFFNYFFPTFYIIILLYLISKNPDSNWLFLIGFIGGALNEQNGLMTVGIFLIFILYDICEKKKLRIKPILMFLVSLAGWATVMLSPGTNSRVEKQGEYTLVYFVRNIITIVRQNLLDNPYTFILMICVTLCVIYWLCKLPVKSKALKRINKLVTVVFSVMSAFNTGLMIFWLWNRSRGGAYSFSTIVNYAVMLLWLFYVFVFISTLIYVTLLIYFICKEKIPFVVAVLAVGSNIMMTISKKLVYRYCTAGIFMFMIFISFTAVNIIRSKSFNPKLSNCLKAGAVCLCILLAVFQAPQAYKYLGIANETELHPLTDSELLEFEEELDSGTYYSSIFWSNMQDVTGFSNLQLDYSAFVDTNGSQK